MVDAFRMREMRWKYVVGPGIFALLAIALLIFDHLSERVTDLVFWLTLGLIVAVFSRMVDTVRKQSQALERQDRDEIGTEVSGLRDREELRDDIDAVLADPDRRQVLVLFELDGLQAYNDRMGFDAGGEQLRRFAEDVVDAVSPLDGAAYRGEGGRLAALAPASDGILGELVLAATDSTRDEPGESMLSRTYGEVLIPAEADEVESALRLAGRRLAIHKQRQQRSARRQAHSVLMAVLSARRPDVQDSLRVVAYRAIALARRLRMSREEIDDIALAAELQRIGLVAVPERILESEGELDEAERALIRSHSVEGERIIAAAPGLTSVARIVRSSAEHFDGSGYPDGLAGESIPMGSRIIAVAAAFAGMTSPRPHHPARTANEALSELRRCAGTQFDPDVVEALAKDLVEEATAAASAHGA
jgi:two-component system, cell cycle response regulator